MKIIITVLSFFVLFITGLFYFTQASNEKEKITHWVRKHQGTIVFEYPEWVYDSPHSIRGFVRSLIKQYVIQIRLPKAKISDITRVANLSELKVLHLEGTLVKNIDVLRNLKKLRWIKLSGTQIENINSLKHLKDLEWLDLSSTRIKDISILAELSNLEMLDLSNTQVSDISVLKDLKQLQDLNIRNTLVSDYQISELQEKIPNCKILKD